MIFTCANIFTPNIAVAFLPRARATRVFSYACEKKNFKKIVKTPQFEYAVSFLAFGIGSMIYSGLEFGQYFELEPATKCHNVLLVLTPATRMAFIFIQMYFIFLNDEVRSSECVSTPNP